jgi:Uma2 family endonuclease
VVHQEILVALIRFFADFFEGKPCKILAAPLDVILPKGDEADEQVKTVVQPDLLVVCDPEKLDRRKCRGAPDLVVEILSPSTSGKDSLTKLNLYERHGVKEYWLVHPVDRLVTIFFLQPDGRFGRPDVHAAIEKKVAGRLFPDLAIDMTRVFPPGPEEPAPRGGPKS